MEETEFIIALTEHRFLGNIFVPYIIQKKEQFYTVKSHVKLRDVKSSSGYLFKPWERELVEMIEKYSDERLVKRFSRDTSVSAFYANLDKEYFDKHISPFVDKCMFQIASVLMLSPVRLLNKEVKYANLYDEDEIEVPPFYALPVFHFERTATETRYRLAVSLDEKEISLRHPNIRVITNEPCILIHGRRLVVFEKLNAKKLLPFFEKSYVSAPNSIEEKYYNGFVMNVVRDFDVEASGFRIEQMYAQKSACLSLEKNLKYEPCFVLSFLYGDEKFLPGSSRKVSVSLRKENGTFVFRKVNRDFEWEKEILAFLEGMGLREENGYWTRRSAELVDNENALYFLINWLNENRRSLDEKGIRIVQDKSEKVYFTGSQHLELKTMEKGDWFDVYATVRIGEFNIPFIRLKKYILNDIREIELPDGQIAVLPEEWFARLKGWFPFARFQGNQIGFDKHHFPLLKNNMLTADSSVTERIAQMEDPGKTEVAVPANLKAKLRSYQEEGFRWMFHLHKNGFGGCLADDMGLGKTLQTLALLLKLKWLKKEIKVKDPLPVSGQLDLFASEIFQEQQQPASLIVVPTSLVHNWDNEIRKFTPSLKTYKHIGVQRKKASEMARVAQFYDVVLTTYGTIRNDSALLTSTEFFYLILDESQYIKNPASKTYKAIMQMKSQHRLVLTGTPIENSLSDLWSQMNFLNKGILGNLAFFQRYFITPIEKHNNQEQQEKLQLMIRPFVLRRKKEEVAKDLPPLTEQVRFCEMTSGQHKKYELEKSIVRNAILSTIEKEGVAKSSIVILQGLTRLRQLANHPSLLEKEMNDGSGKFDEIFRMLENLMAENHKVLIFSSFVQHLRLLQEKIEQQNWKYSMLTGQTTQREKVIRQFQDDPENRIFLISLKAGGVGLNLTQAGYVFILDPWWNPAAENQAVSRAHRIGQEKNVFVYRFITENSIEEKIQLLKERKSSLADKFINSNNPFAEITREEIVELFK